MAHKPETLIREAIIRYLKGEDWFATSLHGNAFQSGFPDIYACHSVYGQRWIEVKNPQSLKNGYSFTNAQIEMFKNFAAKNVGVWILVGATEQEYKKLFQPCNWILFLDIMKNY